MQKKKVTTMRTTSNILMTAAIAGTMLFGSCQKEELTPQGGPLNSILAQRPICGKEVNVNLIKKDAGTYGNISLSNDENNFYVKVETNSPWLVKKAWLWVGDCNNLDDIIINGNVDNNVFPFQSPLHVNQNNYEFTIPRAGLPTCVCYSLFVRLTDLNGNEDNTWGAGNILPGEVFGTYSNYCMQDCDKCDGLRTQTQGGWGAPPNGNNPGAYLHAHFAAAFPAGLTVGCTKTIKLTSAQAVTNFLPQGSSPKVLTTNYVNPTNSKISVLAGQVVALKLSVVFDEYDANFGAGTDLLKNRVIVSGVFQGWTVGQLLAEAEKKLGGCASPYSVAQLNDAVDAVNNNYVDGNTDLGYLDCPKK